MLFSLFILVYAYICYVCLSFYLPIYISIQEWFAFGEIIRTLQHPQFGHHSPWNGASKHQSRKTWCSSSLRVHILDDFGQFILVVYFMLFLCLFSLRSCHSEDAVMPQNITFNLDTGMTGEEQLSTLENGKDRAVAPSASRFLDQDTFKIPINTKRYKQATITI